MDADHSDRAISEYAQDIWSAKPVHVDLEDLSPSEL
jgi:hypothetical protein